MDQKEHVGPWLHLGESRGGENPPGRAQVGCAHLGAPLWYFVGPSCVLWPIKILQKVPLRLTPFDSDILRSKKQAKNSTYFLSR